MILFVSIILTLIFASRALNVFHQSRQIKPVAQRVYPPARRTGDIQDIDYEKVN